MFTGLVAAKGDLRLLVLNSESALIEIATELVGEIGIGDSVSVNGVCLTAIDVSEETFRADVMLQTLKLTSLGNLAVGDKVNIELAARADSRLGGHIVQGHVDGVARVIANSPGEKWNKFVVDIPENLSRYIVNQGSIAVDGVSLTVGSIEGSKLELWLIPETLEKTNLGEKIIGDLVNIEVDVFAKYVEKLLRKSDEK